MAKFNDGGYLEDEVKKELNKIVDVEFRYRRLPDSKAARGFIAAQPADFYFSLPSLAGHIECKSVSGTKPTLPMFDQWAEMRAWSKAGTEGYVLIHFHELDAFFLVDVMDLKTDVASWNLSKFTSYVSVRAALTTIINNLRFVK